MSPRIRLCQFAPAINRGDAISKQAVEMHRAAEALGIESVLFEFGKGNETAVPVSMYVEYEARSDDVIVLQYGGRRHYEDWVIHLPGRVFIYYHNVTPAHFYERIDFPWVEALYRGRDALSELAHLGGLADSEYNKRELLRAGFADVRVLPLIVDFAFTEAAVERAYPGCSRHTGVIAGGCREGPSPARPGSIILSRKRKRMQSL